MERDQKKACYLSIRRQNDTERKEILKSCRHEFKYWLCWLLAMFFHYLPEPQFSKMPDGENSTYCLFGFLVTSKTRCKCPWYPQRTGSRTPTNTKIHRCWSLLQAILRFHRFCVLWCRVDWNFRCQPADIEAYVLENKTKQKQKQKDSNRKQKQNKNSN